MCRSQKRSKENVKTAVKFINDFEKTAAKLAAQKDYDAIVCGHIHQPEIKMIESDKGPVEYLNSGDWIENLTALEFYKGAWSLFEYNKDDFKNQPKLNGHGDASFEEMRNKEVFQLMLKDFQ